MKRCSICGIEKQPDEFYRRKSSKDGLDYRCKACTLAQNAHYAAEHVEQIRRYKTQWAREHPLDAEQKARKAETWQVYYQENHERLLLLAQSEKYKPYRQSYRQRDYVKARANAHFRLTRKTDDFRLRRREKRRGSISERLIKQRRRAVVEANGGSCTLVQWRDLLVLASGKCLACGNEKPLTCDHIIPVALGGSGNLDNLQPLCLSCNSSKQTKIVDYRPDWMREWVQSRGGYHF
jgi:5-methylcytosine-specific restriction endonuclease McrA